MKIIHQRSKAPIYEDYPKNVFLWGEFYNEELVMLMIKQTTIYDNGEEEEIFLTNDQVTEEIKIKMRIFELDI